MDSLVSFADEVAGVLYAALIVAELVLIVVLALYVLSRRR